MAVFDLRQHRLCVRVVYDGVAGAGKTTNLRHLASAFESQRVTELHTPAELGGRTLYFDWLQLRAGFVFDLPLVCQVISVPGQVVLTPRRRHLLASADVVVYVCDSSEAALPRAREGLATLVRTLSERDEPVPVLVQANKQDQTDALDGARLLLHLGGPDLEVVEAIATDGPGVVDTFVSAIRTLLRSYDRRAEHENLRVPVRPADTPARVLARLANEPIDPEWAAELLLEEAADALRRDDGALAKLVFRRDIAGGDPGANAAPAPGRVLAPLPSGDAPSGFLWPAVSGRAKLRELAATRELPSAVRVDAAGEATLTVGDDTFTTSLAHQFEDAEAARQALVRQARWRTQLGSLLLPGTVLVVCEAHDQTSWLWTITPTVGSLAEWLRDRVDAGETATAVQQLVDAYVEALRCFERHGIPVDLALTSFTVHDGVVRYGGALVETPRTAALGPEFLASLSAIDVGGGVLASFVEALAAAIPDALAEGARAKDALGTLATAIARAHQAA